jgi:hypothetical protein
VVLTRYGGEIPESAVMETDDVCEALATKGLIVIRAHGGDGRIERTLTLMSPRVGAVVIRGINEETIGLPRRDYRLAASRKSNWQPDRRPVDRRCLG